MNQLARYPIKAMDGAQSCTRCVMDTSAPDIRFDADGVCNYCTEYLVTRAKYLDANPVTRQQRLDALLRDVRNAGRGKPYDCIIGVSGGVDSSWALALAVDQGLRPLAVHMDNGWNTELAQNNIANLVRGLGVDLHTHVIDWPEYRGLMEAFFAADVVDVELLYDNAMLAVNFEAAARHGVKHILGGTNVATEGMRMPPSWNWLKYDKRNIKSIAKRFGGPKLKTFPSMGTVDYIAAYLRGHALALVPGLFRLPKGRCAAVAAGPVRTTSRIPSSIMSPSSPASTRATSFPISSGSTKGACTCRTLS